MRPGQLQYCATLTESAQQHPQRGDVVRITPPIAARERPACSLQHQTQKLTIGLDRELSVQLPPVVLIRVHASSVAPAADLTHGVGRVLSPLAACPAATADLRATVRAAACQPPPEPCSPVGVGPVGPAEMGYLIRRVRHCLLQLCFVHVDPEARPVRHRVRRPVEPEPVDEYG